MSRFTPPLLIVAALLAACGTSPTGAKQSVRAARQQGLPEATQPLPTASTDAEARARAAAAVARLDAVKTISGKLAFREYKGDAADHGEAAIAFRRKPFAARVDVLESNRALAHGGSLIWRGGSKIEIKPLKLPLKLDFAWDSPQVVSLRGYRIDQTDLFSMGKVLRHPAARVRALGMRRMRGEEFFCLEVFSPGSLPDVRREVIGLHAVHNIPTYREMYDERDRLVHQGQGYGLEIDRTVEAERFEL